MADSLTLQRFTEGQWVLLTEDAAGRLHLDHALADDAARRH
jgi:hypothetical protein